MLQEVPFEVSLDNMLPVQKPCSIRAGEILAKRRKHFTLGFYRYWKIDLLSIVELDIAFASYYLTKGKNKQAFNLLLETCFWFIFTFVTC